MSKLHACNVEIMEPDFDLNYFGVARDMCNLEITEVEIGKKTSFYNGKNVS